MIFFASKLTRQIHQDVTELYAMAPSHERHLGQDVAYFSNQVFQVSDPAMELDEEWDDTEGRDTIPPHFWHYPSGIKVWLGDKPHSTKHSKITEEQWGAAVSECRRIIEAFNRQQAA